MLVAERAAFATRAVLGSRVHRRRRSGAPDAEYLEELDALLREAVRLRLISDVPLGAFLSGGIDSTTVVALHGEDERAPPVTISVGFDDEASTSSRSAQRSPSTSAVTSTRRRRAPHVEELLPRLAWHFDEPFADSSAVPTYYVSKAARQLVTVALSGDGGDELWAGPDPAPRRVLGQRARERARPAGCGIAGWIGRRCRSRRRAPLAASPRRRSRSGLRAQARLRHVRAGRKDAALFRRLPHAPTRGRSLRPFRGAYAACESPTRSTGRCTSMSRPTWSTTS